MQLRRKKSHLAYFAVGKDQFPFGADFWPMVLREPGKQDGQTSGDEEGEG